MGYRLGLDVGTNSLGWSVLELDDTGKVPTAVLDAGVRIFTDGREVKSKSTLKAMRTLARSSRRRLDRFKQRKRYLLSELIEHGLMPAERDAMRALQDIDPLQLRAKGLDESLSLHELGRVLFHLNQRRGFKSNRKDADSRSGVVRDSIAKMQKDLADSGSRTLGEYLWRRRSEGKETRARRSGTKNSDLYQFYPSREILEHEFKMLWASQMMFHSEVLNDDLGQHFFDIIYFQRPLKPQPKGKCSFLENEERCYRALPSFQKYRVLQEINNLEWTTSIGTFSLIEAPQARDLVLELFLSPATKDGKIVFSKMARIVKELGLAEGNFRFNLQSDIRKHLDGDLTAAIMHREDYIGPEWNAWDLEKQDGLISTILDSAISDEDALVVLRNDFGLEGVQAQNVLNAPISDGTSNISVRAARALIEEMEQNYVIQPDAVQRLSRSMEGFHNPYKVASAENLLEELPYYGEYIRGHIIPGRGTEQNHQAKVGMVSNPTVHIALNQIRHVVNELITRFGPPTSISIELGRDLPVGEEGRKRSLREQKRNQDRNDELRMKLRELSRSITHDNLTRLKLWEELGDNPTDRRCIFTGKMIGIADLFNGNCEIEHLLPFSQSLDDSLANKTICHRRANRDKGNRTPYEAFHSSPGDYEWAGIFERASRLPAHKHWRFEENAMQKWLQEDGDFLARHLNDTRYIGRLTREYLTAICPAPKIDVVTGRLTSLLRHYWGLNSVLNLEADAKNRDDHRHHAVDAIIVGMTTRAALQRLSVASKKAEEFDLATIVGSGEEIEPWKGFRDDVEQVVSSIIVSHKPTRQREGKLHNDTAMGIVDGPDTKGKYVLAVRKSAEKFNSLASLQSIKDHQLRNKLVHLAKSLGVKGAFESLGIKAVRSIENMKAIPIHNSEGVPYKAYKGDSNWAMEIYEMPAGAEQEGKWVEVMVTTFEANQNIGNSSDYRKPHPAARLVMRLHRNDYLMFKESGMENLWRVQKISKGMIALTQPQESNTDARNRDKTNPFSYVYKSAGALKTLSARKVHVSPSGMLNPML